MVILIQKINDKLTILKSMRFELCPFFLREIDIKKVQNWGRRLLCSQFSPLWGFFIIFIGPGVSLTIPGVPV